MWILDINAPKICLATQRTTRIGDNEFERLLTELPPVLLGHHTVGVLRAIENTVQIVVFPGSQLWLNNRSEHPTIRQVVGILMTAGYYCMEEHCSKATYETCQA